VEYEVRALCVAIEDGAPATARARLRLPGEGAPACPPFLREGDRSAGPAPDVVRVEAPPSRVRLRLRPGEPGRLDIPRPPPPGTRVAWAVLSRSRATGPFRLRADGGIVIESEVLPADAPGRNGGRRGDADPAQLAGRTLELESGIEGLEALLLEATFPAREDAPAEDHGVRVVRRMPSGGNRGEVVAIAIEVVAPEGRERLVVECPLPAGAVPAEDAWELRRRGGPAVRAALEEDRAVWRLPSGGTWRLELRLRLLHEGRFVVPGVDALYGLAHPGDKRGKSESWVLTVH